MARRKIGRGGGISFSPFLAGCLDTETDARTEDGGDEGGRGSETRDEDG